MTASASTAATPGLVANVRTIAADIKLAHSLFALPFAVLAAFLAARPTAAPIDWRTFGLQLLLVVVAMVIARTAAMLSNRLLDRRIDARNPRTAGRAIPSGRLSPRTAASAIGVCTVLFLLVCAGFWFVDANPWPLILGLPVLAWICAYGVFKRFTMWCHVYLGSSLAISPLAAALAVHPPAIVEQPALWLLSAMVLGWVAGFDVIYALQDVDVDREEGLHSLPSRLGPTRAMWVSRILHTGAAACLVAAALIDPRLTWLFGAGVAIVIGLLLYEHLTVSRWGTTKIALAFFTINGVISCVLGGLGVLDVLV